jgi:AraC-like DNA-binding protein
VNGATQPLIRAAALAGYEEFAREAGLAPATQLRRVGLSLTALRDPEHLISYPAMIALLEHSAQAAGRPGFGLELSQQQGLSVLGPLAVIAQNANDMAQAYELAGRYMFVYSPGIRVTVQPVGSAGRWVDLCFDIDIVPRPVCVQAMELGMGVMANSGRLLSQGEFFAHEILLPHARTKGSTRHEAVLGAPCRFNQPQAALRFRAQDVHRPMRGSNPLLREMALRYIDTQFVSPHKPFSDRIRQVVHRLLGTERSTLEGVSEMLAMHPRALQRRLSDEGTSFGKIKDEVRRDMLESVMRRAEPPSLTTLMTMLEYADPATLTRACRRWFGVPPTALRAGMGSAVGTRRTTPAAARRQA